MFQELQQKALGYLEELDTPPSFLEEIYQKAMQDKAGFEAFIPSVGFGLESTYSIFIEAIWLGDEDDADGWEGFYLREIKRVVNAADTGIQDAIDELSVLMELTDVDIEDKSFYKESIDFLTGKLSSSNAEVRENCIDGIDYLLMSGVIEFPTVSITAIQNLLKKDPSLDVRVAAYDILKKRKYLPKNFKWSMMDKIKIKLTGKSLD